MIVVESTKARVPRRRVWMCIGLGLSATAATMSGLSEAFADTLPTPALVGPLTANPDPLSFDGGLLGKIYAGAVLSGFGFWQSNPAGNDHDTRFDLSNAQVIVQKTDGLLQFYVQAGQYDVLALAMPTVSSRTFTNHAYEFLPQAYLKLAPNNNFSVEIGKLPTLIGDEDTFSFQNPQIERGLLWNQTNGQTRGVQVNYTWGPVLLNLSWNDGYYSDRFDSISGLATWTIGSADTLGFMGAGNAGRSATSTFITPLLQNNQDIFDLMYTHTEGPWTLQPYLQYSCVPRDIAIGVDNSGETWSGAVLAIYNINPQWNLAGRAEYIDTSGGVNLLEGPGSDAWSLTITPTYQNRVFFVRGEASYVAADHTTTGDTTFAGNKTGQFRALVETGVNF
ncbi:MAG: outer membrane beta-barrel protein [Rhizomicrobium sp.]|jgi:hypothetical protein